MLITIYKIINNVTPDTYIGSTKHTLEKRLKQHISNSHNGSTASKLHGLMRKVGYENFKILKIKTYDVKTHAKQLSIEQDYINNLNPSLNLDIQNHTTSRAMVLYDDGYLPSDSKTCGGIAGMMLLKASQCFAGVITKGKIINIIAEGSRIWCKWDGDDFRYTVTFQLYKLKPSKIESHLTPIHRHIVPLTGDIVLDYKSKQPIIRRKLK